MKPSDPALDVQPPPRGSRTGIIVAGAAIVLVGLVGMALLFVDGGPRVAYPPDSAEAALERYLAASEEGDVAAAWSALSTRAQSFMRYPAFQAAQPWLADEAVRVWIDRSHRDEADHVVLELTIERSSDGPLGPTRDRLHRRVTLVREAGTWKIDTPLFRPYEW